MMPQPTEEDSSDEELEYADAASGRAESPRSPFLGIFSPIYRPSVPLVVEEVDESGHLGNTSESIACSLLQRAQVSRSVVNLLDVTICLQVYLTVVLTYNIFCLDSSIPNCLVNFLYNRRWRQPEWKCYWRRGGS